MSEVKTGALFITTEEILGATLQYLSSKPYAEVAHLIDALKQSTPHVSAPPRADKDPGTGKGLAEMEVAKEEVVNPALKAEKAKK